MKLCVIDNTAPRYREAIFTKIDQEFDCDWYFGETKDDIKEMNLSLLKRVTIYKTRGKSSRLYWKSGILKLLFKKEYNTFLYLVESRSITDYLFLFLANIIKKPVYGWTHGWYGKESKVESVLKKWQFRHCTGIFLYGNYARNLLIEQGFPEQKLYTIHNSLHYDQQVELRNQLSQSRIYFDHFGNNNPVIIFIGRLTKVKKLDMLIDAIERLNNKNEHYNLVFVGNGIESNNLQMKVEKAGLQQQVWFYGACYDEKTNSELIYNADLCASPGNVGLTAMHALVFGCPVITHNCFKWQMPEFEAIKPNITGDFFEMDDTDSLADCISNWFLRKSNERETVRKDCFSEIDEQWNPYFQIKVLKSNIKLK